MPKALAAALIGSGLGTEPTDFFVGKPPSGLPGDFTLPEDAQVLGGASIEGFGFPGDLYGSSSPLDRHIVVADVPSWSSSMKARYDSTLAGQGWSRMAFGPQNQRFFQRRQSASLALFCREDAVLRRFISGQEDGGARLKVEYRTGGPVSRFCNRPQVSAGPMQDAPKPSLEPPPETTVVSSGRGMGGGSFSSHPRIETDLSSAALVSHYADQLRDEGWSLESQEEGRGAVTQLWRFEKDSGETWLGFLAVMPLPGTSEQKILFHIAKQ